MDVMNKFIDKTNINSITCDAGREFINKRFIKFCDDNKITLYTVTDDSHKLGILNRFHRTLKGKLSKYFISHNTVKWIDAIDDIIYNYNRSFNRGIGMKPIEVTEFIEKQLIEVNEKKTSLIKPVIDKFSVGDKVRIKKMFYLKIK